MSTRPRERSESDVERVEAERTEAEGAALFQELLARPFVQRDDVRPRPPRRRRTRRRRRLTAGGYPQRVEDVLDDGMKFRRGTLAAVRWLAKQKPYRGSLARRKRLIRELYRRLADVYGIEPPVLRFRDLDGDSSGESSCLRVPGQRPVITLRGKLSVVTALHEFRHALGGDEWQATKWSVNLFKRCFPRSFARCDRQGHMLVQRSRTFTKES